MADDPFYLRCCISGDYATRTDPIEWHHNLIYGGKQVQARFAILPIKRSLHRQANLKRMRQQLDWVMWNRASEAEITRYSKAQNYHLYLMTLNAMFGDWSVNLEAKILGY